MATPPTFVAEYESAWNSTTAPKTTSVTTAVGDLLVACVITADEVWAPGTPTGGTSLTWTLAQSVAVSSYTRVHVLTATATTAETFTFSETASGGSSQWWGFNVLRFSGSDGFGNSSKTNVSSGAPSLALTTAADNSCIVVASGDWNAADGTSRTWRTVNSITPSSGAGTEPTYFRDSSNYTVYVGRYTDAGTAGSKTVGLSAPGSQKYSIVAVEVKGAAGGGATNYDGTASVTVTDTISSAGVVGKVATAAIAATATIAAAGIVGLSTGASTSETATVTAAGVVGTSSGASLAGTATITAAGSVGGASSSGDASLAVTDTIAASGAVGKQTGSSIAATDSITSAGVVGAQATASVGVTATLTAAGTVVAGGSSGAAVNETATVTAAGTLGTSSAASRTVTVVITADGQVGVARTAALATTATLTASGVVIDPNATVYNVYAVADSPQFTAIADAPQYRAVADAPQYTARA